VEGFYPDIFFRKEMRNNIRAFRYGIWVETPMNLISNASPFFIPKILYKFKGFYGSEIPNPTPKF